MRSWKTTTAGIAGIIAIIASAVSAALDGDPGTTVDWNTVIVAVVTSVGLLCARDNDKSSEMVGAK